MRNLILLLLFTLLGYASALLEFQNKFVIVESIEKEWKKWKSVFEKIYESEEEEKERKKIWRENHDYLNSFNREKHSHTLELNEFADLTDEEFREFHLGHNHESSLKDDNGTMHEQRIPYGELPTTVDWRTKGAATPVKNQGQCGSCWSFSATGALEGQYYMKHGVLKSFSEQQLVDCSRKYGNFGCHGGFPERAFRYWETHRAELESEYPYKGKDGKCKYQVGQDKSSDRGFKRTQRGSINALKEVVSTVGPISVLMDASHKSFRLYNKGIYSAKECTTYNLDHAVLVVGYGTEDGEDYWLVKNSWDTWWGLDGYFKIAMRDNMCGICSWARYPVLS